MIQQFGETQVSKLGEILRFLVRQQFQLNLWHRSEGYFSILSLPLKSSIPYQWAHGKEKERKPVEVLANVKETVFLHLDCSGLRKLESSNSASISLAMLVRERGSKPCFLIKGRKV